MATRAPRTVPLLALAGTVLVLLTAACGVSEEDRERGREVEQALSALAGVDSVEVEQRNGLDVGVHNDFTVTMRADATAEEVAEVIERSGSTADDAGLTPWQVRVEIADGLTVEQGDSTTLPDDDPSPREIADLLVSARDGALGRHIETIAIRRPVVPGEDVETRLTASSVDAAAGATRAIRAAGLAEAFPRWSIGVHPSPHGGVTADIRGHAIDPRVTRLWQAIAGVVGTVPRDDVRAVLTVAAGSDPLLQVTLAGSAESEVPNSSFTHAAHGPAWWPVVAAAVDATRAVTPLDLEVIRSSYSRDEGRLSTVLLRVVGTNFSADEPGLGWDEAARRRLGTTG